MDVVHNWTELIGVLISLTALLVTLNVKYKISVVHRDTNSMKDHLIKLAAAEGLAKGREEGIKEGRRRQKDDDLELRLGRPFDKE
jgi:hypothetical protein